MASKKSTPRLMVQLRFEGGGDKTVPGYYEEAKSYFLDLLFHEVEMDPISGVVMVKKTDHDRTWYDLAYRNDLNEWELPDYGNRTFKKVTMKGFAL